MSDRPRPIRPWTPHQRVHTDSGNPGVRLAVKRVCDGCQTRLGDVSDAEMIEVSKGRDLRSVKDQCPLCNGLHALVRIPEIRRLGWNPRDDEDEIDEHRVVCPDRTNPDRDCFVWDRCGCQVPADFDALSVAGQEWLSRPCPGSPTGAHVFMAEFGIVACPKPGSCWHADEADIGDLTVDLGVFDPGVYALDAHVTPDGTADWKLVDVAAYRRDARPPVPTG